MNYIHWSNYIPAVLFVAYMVYVVMKSRRMTCRECGKSIKFRNEDPALRDIHWQCEKEQFNRITNKEDK
jgi:hypothetical protein